MFFTTAARVISDPRGPKGLPGGLDHAGDLPVQRELAGRGARDTELAVVRGRAPAERASVADAHRRRVLRQLLELLLRGEKLGVGRGGVQEDGLQLGALGGELGGEL